MAKILVSSCLLGCTVRYNGSDVAVNSKDFNWLVYSQEIVSFCPEVSAGLPIPRVPAEICGGSGTEVLAGTARVIGSDREDLTDQFILGADLAPRLCRDKDIKFAVLTENSPSCGSNFIYDGSFSGVKKKGVGIVAARLRESGVLVFSQHTVGSLGGLIEISRSI
ncbi:DUF523 domain-containing protein [Microbulbifer variabilis]|uniref:DUF523 domain-containing protein n=1 Tax=Microbulbifer variabilis TaxID=266805 RepID=UPI001CFE5250|nr:DUF523 domain-containing protein [Microbulbifer variabilis]